MSTTRDDCDDDDEQGKNAKLDELACVHPCLLRETVFGMRTTPVRPARRWNRAHVRTKSGDRWRPWGEG